MRMRKVLSATSLAMCLLGMNLVDAAAQAQRRSEPVVIVQQGDVRVATQEGVSRQKIVRGQGVGTGTAQGDGHGDNTFVFVASEMTIDGKIVKGAPYSAEAITETTQVFADGNRIVRKNSAQVYRDNEGRTRREQTIGMIGPFAPPAAEQLQTIIIHDPVAGTNYILDARTKTARRGHVRLTFEREPRREAEVKAQAHAQAQGKGEGQTRMKRPSPGGEGGYVFSTPMPPTPHGAPDMMFYWHGEGEPKVESLGSDIVEGVKADGTRMTVTIPAGAIGNEREINIVTERWYSSELQTTVKTRHSDPRFGETVYRLSNINRNEPAPSLFQVPSDYTIKEGPAGFGRTFRKRSGEPKENNFFFEFNGRPEEN